MKSQQTKNIALKSYLNNLPIYKIAKQLNTTQKTIHAWKDKGKWVQLKKESIEKSEKNVADVLISEQVEITKLAQKELLKRLREQHPDLDTKELIQIMKNGLEVVRPKQSNQYNFMKKEESNQIKFVLEQPDGT